MPWLDENGMTGETLRESIGKESSWAPGLFKGFIVSKAQDNRISFITLLGSARLGSSQRLLTWEALALLIWSGTSPDSACPGRELPL